MAEALSEVSLITHEPPWSARRQRPSSGFALPRNGGGKEHTVAVKGRCPYAAGA